MAYSWMEEGREVMEKNKLRSSERYHHCFGELVL